MATAFMEEDLTCSICLSLFDLPKTLTPCLHTFCKGCISDLITKTQTRKSFKCPMCKERLHLPPNGVDGLKDDFRIKSMVERFRVHQKKIFCEKHKANELNVFCRDCKEVICSTCMLEIHKTHNLDNVDHALKTAEEEMKRNMEASKKVETNAKLRAARIAVAQNSVKDRESSTVNFVSGLFVDILDESTEHKGDLTKKCNELFETIQKLLVNQLSLDQNRQKAAADLLAIAHNFFRKGTCSSIEKLQQYASLNVCLTKVKSEPMSQTKTRQLQPPSGLFGTGFRQLELLQKPQCTTSFNAQKGPGKNRKFHDIGFSKDRFIVVNSDQVEIFSKHGAFHRVLNAVTCNDTGDLYTAGPEERYWSNKLRIACYNPMFEYNSLLKSSRPWIDGSRIACFNNNIIIAGREHTTRGTLLFIDKNGEELNYVSSASLGLKQFIPNDVSTTPQGNIITADLASKCVYILDRLGKRILHTYRPRSPFLAFSDRPPLVCCDKRGHIIVYEVINTRKQEDKLFVESVAVDGELLKFAAVQRLDTSEVRAITICGEGMFAALHGGDRPTVNVYKFLI